MQNRDTQLKVNKDSSIILIMKQLSNSLSYYIHLSNLNFG